MFLIYRIDLLSAGEILQSAKSHTNAFGKELNI